MEICPQCPASCTICISYIQDISNGLCLALGGLVKRIYAVHIAAVHIPPGNLPSRLAK